MAAAKRVATVVQDIVGLALTVPGLPVFDSFF
jgi:hypothetical protein